VYLYENNVLIFGYFSSYYVLILVSSHGEVDCLNIIKELYLYDQHVLYFIIVNYRMVKKFIETKIDPNKVAKYWLGYILYSSIQICFQGYYLVV